MGLFHVAYNGYVWKTPLPQRHPERSRGIFLAGGDNVVCMIVEKGKTFAKEARKSRVQGRFLDFARNDGMGEWVYFTQRTTDMFGKRYSCIVIPSEVEGSFLHTGIAPYVRQRKMGMLLRREQESAEKGKPFVKGARKSGVQGRFLAALEMTVCGNEGSHKFEISNKLTNVKESHLNMSIIMCYIKTSIKAPMLLY